MCGAPCTDDSDGMMIALLQFAAHVEHDWWCMDFTQRPGIRWRVLRDDRRTKIAHPFEFRGKIDSRFPVGNLVCDLVADSFDLAKLAASRSEDLLRLSKNFEQFPQPHRPDSRQHVERDANFSRVHSKLRNG